MFNKGNWIRPGDGMMGDNFKRIDDVRIADGSEFDYEYYVTCFWDWEKNIWVKPFSFWDDGDIIEGWSEYTEQELIKSLFVEGIHEY